MNKIKLVVVLIVAVSLFAVMVLHTQSNEVLQSTKVKQKEVSAIKTTSANTPERAPLVGSRQGYQLVTGVLDAFGGESESDNYRIPVNSGGQPSAIGISESESFEVKAGFVHASHVRRGDANSDGAVAPGDVVFLINYLFRGGPEPCPMEAGDANCDGVVGPGDIVYLLNYLFRGWPPPSC